MRPLLWRLSKKLSNTVTIKCYRENNTPSRLLHGPDEEVVGGHPVPWHKLDAGEEVEGVDGFLDHASLIGPYKHEAVISDVDLWYDIFSL